MHKYIIRIVKIINHQVLLFLIRIIMVIMQLKVLLIKWIEKHKKEKLNKVYHREEEVYLIIYRVF